MAAFKQRDDGRLEPALWWEDDVGGATRCPAALLCLPRARNAAHRPANGHGRGADGAPSTRTPRPRHHALPVHGRRHHVSVCCLVPPVLACTPLHRGGVDSCSFNTSNAEIIVGGGGDPWAPTAGSMLQISTRVAQRLWRPLVRTAQKLDWRLPGGFEVGCVQATTLTCKHTTLAQQLLLNVTLRRNAKLHVGLMAPAVNFKGVWQQPSTKTYVVTRFLHTCTHVSQQDGAGALLGPQAVAVPAVPAG